jgi:hypothetical protein
MELRPVRRDGALRTILAAEDEKADRFTLELALDRSKLPHARVIVRDGRDCVDLPQRRRLFYSTKSRS